MPPCSLVDMALVDMALVDMVLVDMAPVASGCVTQAGRSRATCI